MRVQRVLLIAALLGVPATATAAAQPLGRQITITKGAHDYVLHLGPRLRPVVAGQRVAIRCAHVHARRGFRPSPHPAPVQRTARVPRTRGPVHTGIPVGRFLDLCLVRYTSSNGSGIVNVLTDSVTVPITARGRAYDDDLNAAYSLFVPLFAAPAGTTTPPPAATIVA